ncbi:hypothetical protein MNV49_002730 [Pseudohyphozyma bogoriensis]|nr:hypothetical protein MNV49_002730 [Pseudohyphozyma bogoriensis]
MVELNPASAVGASTSSQILAALESELVKELAHSPFPPLLFSSHLSTLIAQTYVSSHPLSGLVLHSAVAPTKAHDFAPSVLPTALEEFTYEPNFAIGIMERSEEELEGAAGGRLLEEFGGDEDGEVQTIVGGKDKVGWKHVVEWMEANNLVLNKDTRADDELKQIRHERSKRPSYSPPERLPPELLAEVFLFAAQGYELPTRFLAVVACLSRFWCHWATVKIYTHIKIPSQLPLTLNWNTYCRAILAPNQRCTSLVRSITFSELGSKPPTDAEELVERLMGTFVFEYLIPYLVPQCFYLRELTLLCKKRPARGIVNEAPTFNLRVLGGRESSCLLTSLHLSHCLLAAPSNADKLPKFYSLRHLALSFVEISGNALRALTDKDAFPALQVLSIIKCTFEEPSRRIPPGPPDGHPILLQAPALIRLFLSIDMSDEEEDKNIKFSILWLALHLDFLTEYTTLMFKAFLDEQGIQWKAIAIFTAALLITYPRAMYELLHRAWTLHISHYSLDTAKKHLPDAFPEFYSLRHLSFSFVSMTREVQQLLGDMDGLPALQTLSLFNCSDVPPPAERFGLAVPGPPDGHLISGPPTSEVLALTLYAAFESIRVDISEVHQLKYLAISAPAMMFTSSTRGREPILLLAPGLIRLFFNIDVSDVDLNEMSRYPDACQMEKQLADALAKGWKSVASLRYLHLSAGWCHSSLDHPRKKLETLCKEHQIDVILEMARDDLQGEPWTPWRDRDVRKMVREDMSAFVE